MVDCLFSNIMQIRSFCISRYYSSQLQHFKGKHMISRDAETALARMFQRHVGITVQNNKTKKFDPADIYFASITQYDTSTIEVQSDVLLDMLHEIFDIYHPAHYELDQEEREEVCVLFKEWLLTNDMGNSLVSFQLFQTWFLNFTKTIERRSRQMAVTSALYI
jgi:hypothetical protein